MRWEKITYTWASKNVFFKKYNFEEKMKSIDVVGTCGMQRDWRIALQISL
jgi:hypothetical protein